MIVWDEPKRLANLAKHGFDFADLTPEFFVDAMILPAGRGRLKAVNRLNQETLAVIFTALGSEGLSVISMRPASRNERSLL